MGFYHILMLRTESQSQLLPAEGSEHVAACGGVEEGCGEEGTSVRGIPGRADSRVTPRSRRGMVGGTSACEEQSARLLNI